MAFEKIVLVTRKTRLMELIARFNTRAQAKFYIEHSGGDFAEYEREDAAYAKALTAVRQSLEVGLKVQLIDRELSPTFLFAPTDIVVTLGQDGLVANTAKYVGGQPLVAINPDPERFDGVLLPFAVAQARALFVNTVHRFQGGRPQPGEDDQPVDAPADLAHQELTFFQGFTIAALAALPQLQVIQLHGFADGGVPECPQALVVVSPGAAPAGAAEAAQVSERLGALFGSDKVLLYPRDTRRYGAQRNVQGRAVAVAGRATFLHIELSHTLRTRLSDDGALRRAFIAAVIGGGAQ